LRNPACGEFRAARSIDFDVWAEDIRVALAAVIATKRQVVQEEIEGSFIVN
jgi:hypothetical protein